jgi:flavin reductase (DIM6/NTAB) family NADH-FMN oxidoreductase RutF
MARASESGWHLNRSERKDDRRRAYAPCRSCGDQIGAIAEKNQKVFKAEGSWQASAGKRQENWTHYEKIMSLDMEGATGALLDDLAKSCKLGYQGQSVYVAQHGRIFLAMLAPKQSSEKCPSRFSQKTLGKQRERSRDSLACQGMSAYRFIFPSTASRCASVSDSFHSYEPRQGHRLPHDPFNLIVGPRPIGWISTRAVSGVLNLAPYSFFNAFNYIPPIIGFSSIGRKDTLRNVEQTGEFAWNLVTRPMAEAMNRTSAALSPDASEFTLAGLTPLASRLISTPRVAESPVTFECRCTQIVQLQSTGGDKLATWLALGEVLMVHIAASLLKDGIYDTAAAHPVLRGGGPGDYFTIGPEQLFRMRRPK